MKSSKGECIRKLRTTIDCGVESMEHELTPSFLLTRSVHFSGFSATASSSRFRSFCVDPLYEFPVVSATQSTELDDKKTSTSTVFAGELTKVSRNSLKCVLAQLQEHSPFPSDICLEETSQDLLKCTDEDEEHREETSKKPPFATIFDSKCSLYMQTVEETIQSSEEAMYSTSSLLRTFEEQKFGEMIEECENEESVGFFRSTEALRLAIRREAIEEEDGEDVSLSFAEEPPHCSAACFFPPGVTASKNRLHRGPRKFPPLTQLAPKVLDTTSATSFPDPELIEVPDSASPICRKLVICHSTSDNQMEVSNVWPCTGFQTTLKLEFSDTPERNNAGFKGDQSEGFLQLLTGPIVSVFAKAKVKWFSSGFEHCCVVTTDGTVYTWGNGGSGCLGHGDIQSQTSPRRLVSPRMRRVTYIECGAYHNAAVTDSGEMWTWGRGDVHQLGVSQSLLTKDSVGYVALVPVLVEELAQRCVKAVACGEAHTLVLDQEGRVYAFGWSEEGQLGLPASSTPDGQSSRIHTIPLLSDVRILKISAGALFSACLSDSGRLYTWGNGELGQLGLGPEIRFLCAPLCNPAFDADPVLDFQCGENSVVCLTVSGGVWGWGKGFAGKFESGRFETGTELIRCSPIRLDGANIAHKIVVQAEE